MNELAGREPQFKPVPKGEVVTTPEKDEPERYGNPAAPKKPNSVMIPIGKRGFLSWESASGIAVLALIMLVLILVAMICLALISRVPSGETWAGKVAELLGQAVLTIVGAIIGSAATSRARKP